MRGQKTRIDFRGGVSRGVTRHHAISEDGEGGEDGGEPDHSAKDVRTEIGDQCRQEAILWEVLGIQPNGEDDDLNGKQRG